ncbi:MAG: glycosyltransferase family 39 protein [Synergistales bacterium]|nr:glycosyltransferase family 39 protein [Synergistales bacterium]
MERALTRRRVVLYVGIALVMIGCGTWMVPLTAPDEGRNAAAAWTMLQSGDWITPWFNGHIRFAKPPLLYYLTAPAMAVFGQDAVAARLPSVAASLGMVLVLFGTMARSLGRREAVAAALVWITNIHVLLESRGAVPEMTLVFFQFLAFLLLVRGTGLTGETPGRGKVLLAWAAAGLAVLAKGPIGFLLPGASALLCAFLCNRALSVPLFLRRAWLNAGPGIFLLIAGPWYGAMVVLHGDLFVEQFLVANNLARFTGSIAYHDYPFWQTYLPVLLVAFWLWHPFWGGAARAVRQIEGKKGLLLKALAVNAIVVIVFYSLAANKLHHYLLASYPGLSVLLGCGFAGAFYGRGTRWILALQGVLELAGAVCLFVFASAPLPLDFRIAGVCLAATGCVTLRQAMVVPWGARGRLQLARGALMLALLLSLIVQYGGLYRPQAMAAALEGVPAGLFKREQAAVIFYSGRDLPILESEEAVVSFAADRPRVRIWVLERHLERVEGALPRRTHRIVRRGWDLEEPAVVMEITQ